MSKTLIIAEAGVNHNGSVDLAKKLVEVAAEAKADYVKFQTFKTELEISKTAAKAEYQLNTTGEDESQFDMVKKLELDIEAHKEIIAHCKKSGIKFLSTAFDMQSIETLNDLDIDLFKIPSGEITHLPFLRRIGELGKPVILSTGMATLGEIEKALEVLMKAGTQREDITILHCNTEYPTPIEDVNLNAMNTIAVAFDTEVGYSDHTLGIEVPIAAVAMGAVCIEKHFTLDRTMEGPDHVASLEPAELAEMVKAIRKTEKALGGYIKQASPSETKNIVIARKSIHIFDDVPAGHKLTAGDLIMKRPGDGISPMLMDEIVGKVTKRALSEDTKLSYGDIEIND